MKVRIITEYDPETGSYAAYCPELPGCCSAGDTEEEALQNAQEAVALYLEPAPLKLKPDEKVFEVEMGTLKSIIEGSGIPVGRFTP